MNREFLDLYNRELALLYEQAKDFAAENPTIAGRLGGLVRDRMDPMVDGLLQGTAFLAARVHLKMQHEFPEFTGSLIEQLVPNYLAPSPSVGLVRVEPPFGDPGLRDGRTIARGTLLDSVYRLAGRDLTCRYRLTAPIELWPFDILEATYLSSPGQLRALGVGSTAAALAGLRLVLSCRGAAARGDEMSDADARAQPPQWLKGCRASRLRVHIVGAEADTVALYEQIFAHRTGLFFRTVDEFGNGIVIEAPADTGVAQIGFEENETLLPNDARIFAGFDLLRDFFLFPGKFCGFDLVGLDDILPRLPVKSVEVILTFDQVDNRLGGLRAENFALYAGAAVNLFELTADRIPIRTRESEHQVVPDRSHPVEFEPHSIREVFAFFKDSRDKLPVLPLYAAQMTGGAHNGLYYTVRRLPRQRTASERSFGAASSYAGTDMYLQLVEPAALDDARSVAELSVRVVCSNRHLAEDMPVGQAAADFRIIDDVSLAVVCIGGPTKPRQPIVAQMRGRGEVASTGMIAWRLINMLALNHLGLVERGAGRDGVALREILSLFADLSDNAQERRIRGVRSVDAAPVTRRVRQGSGVGVARGTEITVTLDEKAFEGSGVFLLGAILDRFFAEYAAMNHCTQTVVRSTDRQSEIMRWPVRMGVRRAL